MRFLIVFLCLLFFLPAPAQAQYLSYNLQGAGGYGEYGGGFFPYGTPGRYTHRYETNKDDFPQTLARWGLGALVLGYGIHEVASYKKDALRFGAGYSGTAIPSAYGGPTTREYIIRTVEERYEQPSSKRAKPEIPAKKIGEGTWLVPQRVEVEDGDWQIEGIGVVKGVPEEKRIFELEKAVEELKKQKEEKAPQSSFNDRPPQALLVSDSLIRRANIESDNRLYEMDVPVEPQPPIVSPSKFAVGSFVKSPDGSTWKVIKTRSEHFGWQLLSRR